MGELASLRREAATPFDLSLTCMLVVTFMHSTSPAFGAAVHIASGAPHYGVIGAGRSAMHVAGFEPTREDAARALALLSLIGDWKSVQAWCRGKQLIGHWNIRRVLDCYLSAESCGDWRAHCVVTVDIERDHRAFPCRLALPAFHFDARHPASYADQAHAAVVRHGCDWCPRFDPSVTGRVSVG